MHEESNSAKLTAREVGQTVRQSRKALGLRQDELAMAAGVSTRTIHQIEAGKPTSRLDSITPVLEVLGFRLKLQERAGIDPGHGGDR